MTNRKTLLAPSFKANAERIAALMRQELGLPNYAPLCAFKLAAHLGISVKSIYECGFPEDDQRYDDWSATLLYNHLGKPIIIHNKSHSLPRQQSNLMHEISHYYCKHPLSEQPLNLIVPTNLLLVNPLYEEEASWLGATLQLPRKVLDWALVQQRMSLEEIEQMYIASQQMIQYRINVTGMRKIINQLKPVM